jgi:hypothetical protein
VLQIHRGSSRPIEAATAVREPISDSSPARFSVGLRAGQTLQDMTPIIVATLAVFDRF